MTKTPDTPIPAWASVKAYEMANNDTNVFEYPSDHPLVKEIARLLAVERTLQGLQAPPPPPVDPFRAAVRAAVIGAKPRGLNCWQFLPQHDNTSGESFIDRLVSLLRASGVSITLPPEPVNPATTFTHLRDADGSRVPVIFLRGPIKPVYGPYNRPLYRWSVRGEHRLKGCDLVVRSGALQWFYEDGTSPYYPQIRLIRDTKSESAPG